MSQDKNLIIRLGDVTGGHIAISRRITAGFEVDYLIKTRKISNQ